MNADKLASMANQVAGFFRSYPEDEACAGIRDHIEAFWTPGMRQAMLAGGPQAGLDPLVVTALWTAPHAESPVRKETAGPEMAGQLASDAG